MNKAQPTDPIRETWLPLRHLLPMLLAAATGIAAEWGGVGDDDTTLPQYLEQLKDYETRFETFPLAPVIPLEMTLAKPGYVTLVVDDEQGRRVRNIVGAEFFEAGKQTFWWDGLVEADRDQQVHGIYDLHHQLASPGTYRVRGIVRDRIDLRYEFTVYNPGNPPWEIYNIAGDSSGRWLADHTPPSDIAFLPQTRELLICSPVAEAGDGFARINLQGEKTFGKRAATGFSAAYALARNASGNSDRLYMLAIWRGELAIWDYPDFKKRWSKPYPGLTEADFGGLAVFDNLLVYSVASKNELVFLDLEKGEIVATQAIDNPAGLAFDPAGHLFVFSNHQLRKYSLSAKPATVELSEPETIIDHHVEAPQRLAWDGQGNLYVSDHGNSHQVKVFSAAGEFLRAVGTAGGARLGAYDETRMINPLGITISEDDHLWVAEYSQAVKRVSKWTLDGQLIKAFYGPPRYGGGGNLHPDRKRLYYAHGASSGLEFDLDWEAGTSRLANLYFLPRSAADPGFGPAPQTPVIHQGRTYLLNAFNSQPTTGTAMTGIWKMENGIAIPVAAAGLAARCSYVKDNQLLPGNELDKTFFVWSDLNGDGKVQADEMSFAAGTRLGIAAPPSTTVNVTSDLSVVFSEGVVLRPQRLTDNGVPVYDFEQAEGVPEKKLGQGVETIKVEDRFVVTGGPIRGHDADGRLVWTYPSQWPSLHATHGGAPKRPLPSAGQMLGTTRVLGHPIRTTGGINLWGLNANLGEVYLLTDDGLFVDSLFEDFRLGRAQGFYWGRPWALKAERGMLLNDATAKAEYFWTTLNQADDGQAYLVVGINHCSIVHLDGIHSLERLPETTFELTAEQLADVHRRLLDYHHHLLAGKKNELGLNIMKVRTFSEPPVFETLFAGDAPSWHYLGYYHNRMTRKTPVHCLAGTTRDKLHLAFKTGDAKLLDATNHATVQEILLHGGALDLHLGAPGGDLRLLVTLANRKVVAFLLRSKTSDNAAPQGFDSGWRSLAFDSVEEVGASVELASKDGNYLLSVPLSLLGLDPLPDGIPADVGIIRTVRRRYPTPATVPHRLYWYNEGPKFVADPAGEAMPTPHLRGRWEFAE